jgi:uncharacterized protein YkwD
VGATLEEAYQQLLDSPSHYVHIVDRRFNYVGIAVVYANGQYWVVQEFMQL